MILHFQSAISLEVIDKVATLDQKVTNIVSTLDQHGVTYSDYNDETKDDNISQLRHQSSKPGMARQLE